MLAERGNNGMRGFDDSFLILPRMLFDSLFRKKVKHICGKVIFIKVIISTSVSICYYETVNHKKHLTKLCL
jgi:hypothetical protein